MRVLYLFFLISSLMFSQNKLTKSDVIGKWEVKVKVKQLLKEETKDLDMFEKMAVQLASGFAEDILDTADIYILFKKNNTATLTLNFLDYDEEEEVKWSIVDDEIVIAIGGASSGRAHARTGDRYQDMKEMGLDPK